MQVSSVTVKGEFTCFEDHMKGVKLTLFEGNKRNNSIP